MVLTNGGLLHGSFRNEQMMASSSEEVEVGESLQNKPQTIIEALAFMLGHYDWQPGREAGAIIISSINVFSNIVTT